MDKCTDCKKRSWEITYTDTKGQAQEVIETGCQFRVSYFGRDPQLVITTCNQYQQE